MSQQSNRPVLIAVPVEVFWHNLEPLLKADFTIA